jgi:hypothetical protein
MKRDIICAVSALVVGALVVWGAGREPGWSAALLVIGAYLVTWLVVWWLLGLRQPARPVEATADELWRAWIEDRSIPFVPVERDAPADRN